jgi:hypothetical protein
MSSGSVSTFTIAGPVGEGVLKRGVELAGDGHADAAYSAVAGECRKVSGRGRNPRGRYSTP